MNKLGQLLAEQSSPAEVLVFLAVIVAVFLGVAFLVYVLIMLFLRVGLPASVPLGRVLFPSGQQLAEHLGDYLLAMSTSVLLSATLMVKHDVVQQIEGISMQDHSEEVSRLFDFGLPPGLYEEVGGATLSEVVQPLLAAGKVEESNILVSNIVRGMPDPVLRPAFLIGACLLVAAIYLLWLARRRLKALRKNPGSSPEYATTFRSLLTLSICVGLLLASALPLARGGEKILARSAINSILHGVQSGRQPSPVSRQITVEIQKQKRWARLLYCPDCRMPTQSIWKTVATGSPERIDLEPFLTQVNDATAECRATCGADIARLEARLAAILRRLDALDAIDSDITDFGSQFDTLDGKISELQAGLRNLEGRHDRDLRSQFDALDRKISDLRAGLGGLEGRHDGDIRELNRRVSYLEGLHSNLPGDTDRRENPVAAGSKQEDRVETQQGIRSRIPSMAVRSMRCAEYAKYAVSRNQNNLENKCNLTGGQWSSNYDGHYNWCVNAPEEARKAETEARDSALRECLSSRLR